MGEKARGLLRGQGGGNRDPEVQWSGPQGDTNSINQVLPSPCHNLYFEHKRPDTNQLRHFPRR